MIERAAGSSLAPCSELTKFKGNPQSKSIIINQRYFFIDPGTVTGNHLIFLIHGLLPSKINGCNYANELKGLLGRYQGPTMAQLHKLLHWAGSQQRIQQTEGRGSAEGEVEGGGVIVIPDFRRKEQSH
ncbi:hypothetical protein GDO81_021731 [Engystomops pustulosus]|uniref:Uncharacterized protein n=1 Tax=Engystomops pustulosus TaxID=76066 RepID=A0AAV6YQM3_ENGPU|nr:hypothetical protein GDO81_021731 [Engystomops pustulosus]